MIHRLAAALVLLAAMAACLAARPAAALAAPADHGGASHEAEDETAGLNPINSWRSDLAIWTAVVFLLLLVVLRKFAWGPIVQGLQKRERAIADQIAQAERNNQDAQKLLADYREKLAGSEQEVQRMIDKAKRDAEEAGRQIVEEARKDAETEHQRAVREIESATAAALKELSERSASLAVDLAGRIVRAELKPADHAALIEETVAGFSRAKAGPNGNH